jgi:hypothetical protein
MRLRIRDGHAPDGAKRRHPGYEGSLDSTPQLLMRWDELRAAVPRVVPQRLITGAHHAT